LLFVVVIGTSGNGPILRSSSRSLSSAKSSNSFNKSASSNASDAPNRGDEKAVAISSARRRKK
jgi:hypothetical protein